MNYALPELERRYRRFLEGRGDVVVPLLSFLGGGGGGRALAEAQAALVLSRIFLLKGSMGLALSFLRISSLLYRSMEDLDYPLGIWVNRAIVLKTAGKTCEAEGLLRRVFDVSLRSGQILSAAKAASNLATLLARSDRLGDSAAFLAFAEKSYGPLGNAEGMFRLRLARALLELRRGMFGEASDRILDLLADPSEGCFARERIIGRLMLAEVFLHIKDYGKAGRALEIAASNEEYLRVFRPLRARMLFLRHLLLRRKGCCGEAGTALEEAEKIRRSLGLGPFSFSEPESRPGIYTGSGSGGVSSRGLECSEGVSPLGAAGYVRASGRNPSSDPHGLEETGSAAAKLSGRRKDVKVSFITRDLRLNNILEEIKRAAGLPLPILLLGETGVGKDLVSRMIHQWSKKGGRPYVAVNAAALTKELLESTLFGHARGAFTGAITRRAGILETAGSGTIFLDEIGELEQAVQAKLLRFLDSGEYQPLGDDRLIKSSARIVAATNRDLESARSNGSFRGDLFYRLSVLKFRIPPLRERPCDILPIAEHFIERATALYGLGPFRLSGSAARLLVTYSWPGNARELQSEILKASVKLKRGVMRGYHFSEEILGEGRGIESNGEKLPSKLKRLEREEAAAALRICGGNRTRASSMLGIKRTTLLSRMKRLGLD